MSEYIHFIKGKEIYMKKKLVLMTSALMAISLLAGCGHSHEWGEVTYTWADDNSTCTARRVCANDSTHVEEEVATATISNITATCTEDGTSTYTATFKKEGFVAQVKENVPYKAFGHDYQFVEFVWTETPESFTAQAKYVCSHDASHIQLNDATVTNKVTTQPGCETEGVRTYTASYDGHTGTKTEAIPATKHNWGEPTYVWSDDYSTCTASAVCKNDSSHKLTETVNSVYTLVTPASEISEGLEKYTATFTKEAFEVQEKEFTLDKLHYLGRTPILSEDGKTLTYGLYPQTNVNDSTLVSALNALTTPESNGWYLYNNDYYAKVSAAPMDSSYVFDNGTTIVSGTPYWFKCEPITWNVLDNNAGQCYIVSSVLLDNHCYNNSTDKRTIDDLTIYANNYEYSDIRTWLNNDFYNSAFALSNSFIQTTTVDNSASTTNSSSNKYACNNTQDKVFLPSYQDYINSSYGFSTETGSTDTRHCRTTDWARARGAYYNTNIDSSQYYGWYWTRSPYSDISGVACFVYASGSLSNNIVHTNAGVRPGLSIKIA